MYNLVPVSNSSIVEEEEEETEREGRTLQWYVEAMVDETIVEVNDNDGEFDWKRSDDDDEEVETDVVVVIQVDCRRERILLTERR
jgi:hypothetical protein